MTISATANRVAYAGNGTANPLAVAFPFQMTTDLVVIETIVATGVQTTKAITTDYTVSGTPDANGFYPNGGTVTPVAVIAAGKNWIIYRDPPSTQLVHLVDNDKLPAASIENPFDKLTMLAQRLRDRANLSITAPDGDNSPSMTLPPAQVRASGYLGFDASGNVSITSLTGVQAVVAATSLEVFVSKSASLAAADAAAVILGAILVVDQNATLGVNTTLAAKAVHFRGGVITRGAFNLTINGSVTAADVAIFDKAGAGTVTISQGAANFAWYGCSRDGVADDTAPINRALAGCKAMLLTFGTYAFAGTLLIALAGTTITGLGASSSLKGLAGTGKTNVTASNVSVRNLTYTGSSAGENGFVLGPTGAVSKIVIEDVTFTGGNQSCVWLYTCSQVWVNRCTFTHVFYGVLQQFGFSCNTIKVTNCVASDMLADFVEMNGDGGGFAYDILIEGNSYLGANNWTAPQIIMFVGLTNVSDVKILNNYVQNVAGDGAVHLEDVGGRITIQGNTFIDCNVSGGNNGWIYLLNSAKIVLISNNWFIKTGALATACAAISTGSGIYGNSLIISGNFFIGVNTNFTAIDLSYHQGYGLVDANFVHGCGVFLNCPSGTTKRVSNNYVESTPVGIQCVPGVSQSAGTDFEVSNNTLTCSSYSILAQSNGGITRPQKWTVQGNKCGGNVRIDDGIDCFGTGNTYVAGLTYMTIGFNAYVAPTRCVDKNDFQIGTGLIHP